MTKQITKIITMNPETGHLRDLQGFSFNELKQLSEEGYEPIPDHLQKAAKRALNGKKETYISATSGGRLSNHRKRLMKFRKDQLK